MQPSFTERKYLEPGFSLSRCLSRFDLFTILNKMAEVIAISALLWKAAEFLPQIRDGLYKGSAELDEFPIKVAILRAKHAQWTSLLRKVGMTEDEHLKPLIKAAVQILDKEQEYASTLQKSRFRRLRRRAFPGKLNGILSSLVDTVDACHQLLQTRVETNDLFVRCLGQTPCPLPFRPDRKYVPILDTITEVRKALEDADGSYVVTLHGGPGMGKSSLVKYLALYYQQLRKQQMVLEAPTTLYFPDGVFYLYCGRGAKARIRQLQLTLLESLGGGSESSAQSNSCTSAPEEHGEFVHLPSHDTKLRFYLAEQKSLIILDDVWEVEVMEKLLVPGENVKYLVTSQIGTICADATLIGLKSPNNKEARKILANYTQGLPTKGEFPDRIQSVADAIIRELQYHPLSLANIGTSINRSRATDIGEWKAVLDSLWESDEFDGNDVCISPLVYGSRYPLTLRASMMLMVNSLYPEARHLLFLTGLMQPGCEIPEVLVKFFLKQIQPTGWRNRYRGDIKYLEDRSLVEYRSHHAYDYVVDEAHTNRPALITHGLRIYYIRQNHTVNVTRIATEIFSGGSGSSNDHGGQLVQSGCSDEALATILGAMYIEKPFRDAVATKLETQIRVFNSAVIPRSMNYDVDAQDVMGSCGLLKIGLRSLVWLLNPDGEGGWKQQAHEYAKKVVVRLAFRNELDDESMAGLIQLPNTTTAACEALLPIVLWYLSHTLEDAFVDQNITFSSVHGQTMQSLNDACYLHDNAVVKNRCHAIFRVLGWVLHLETDDTVLNIAKKWVEFLGKNSSPTLQSGVAEGICSIPFSRATALVGEFPGLCDHLLMLTVEGRSLQVRGNASEAIYNLCKSRIMASKIGAIPGALEILFKNIFSKNFREYYFAGKVWDRLTCIPEIRARFKEVHGGLEGLTSIFTGNSKSLPNRHREAFKILANLAMTKEIRETIFAVAPQVQEALQLLQFSYFSKSYPVYESMYEIKTLSRAMTLMLDPLQPNPIPVSNPPPRACYQAYMGSVRAYQQLQMYPEALEALNIAEAYFKQVHENDWPYRRKQKMKQLSFDRIFCKAMLEDYAGAMMDVNIATEKFSNKYEIGDKEYEMLLGERGVLKQLVGVDLAGALVDLDKALHLEQRWRRYRYQRHISYAWLKHRGLVKHMMGDEVGARADAESALQLKFHERTSHAKGPKRLLQLPVNYLGFSL